MFANTKFELSELIPVDAFTAKLIGVIIGVCQLTDCGMKTDLFFF